MSNGDLTLDIFKIDYPPQIIPPPTKTCFSVIFHVSVNGKSVFTVVQAPDFGIVLDSSLFLLSYFHCISKSGQLFLQNISRIRLLLTTPTALTLAQATKISSLLFQETGLFLSVHDILQPIHTAAEWLFQNML